jgi:hypothetical protein
MGMVLRVMSFSVVAFSPGMGCKFVVPYFPSAYFTVVRFKNNEPGASAKVLGNCFAVN